MEYARTGFILLTDKYQQCVAFYRDVLELPVMFTLDGPDYVLTCFDLGRSYLITEPGGPSASAKRGIEQSPVKLRLNVADIDKATLELQQKGVSVERRDYPWGSIADFTDPDGNRCCLRSESDFGFLIGAPVQT
jgi:lactoylglutathione lyase